ncbi:hypothetical protein [Leptolyngbya sp. NIES-2104]|uniref:hypothetical protein n=1 Tax=Leptolyngbya sp. NIES-2104 TaxID=1552121 RepID=UPI0006ECBE26|nr:hypothetical protein [Leptolyngbya sp. NIES-2104]GAP94253.1 putative calcium binding hemolysin protein [Leptolyngbya sp. NIES-2104]
MTKTDVVIGSAGNDRVFGDAGDDLLFGVTPNSPQGLGRGEIDFLTGGSGRDTFALAGSIAGETQAVLYDDGDPSSAGIGDYGVIADFQSNDVIQLIGEASRYSLGSAPQGVPSGTGVFLNDSATPELIGIVAGVSPGDLSLTDPTQFTFSAQTSINFESGAALV